MDDENHDAFHLALAQELDELRQKIERFEIDLTPPEEGLSSFTVFPKEGAERQMVVHFIVAEDYSISPPEKRSDAQSAFLKIIKEHRDHQNILITHGDLMVLRGVHCNYYCYVAKVDRYPGTSGFQDEDGIGAAISEEYNGEVKHELVIWTETYPGEGGVGGSFDVTVITVSSGSSGTLTFTELTITPKPPDPEISVHSLEVEPSLEDPFGPDIYEVLVNKVTPGVYSEDPAQYISSQSISADTDTVGSPNPYNTSQAYFASPTEDAKPSFYFNTRDVDAVDEPEGTGVPLKDTDITIAEGKCYEKVLSSDEWEYGFEVGAVRLYASGEVVKYNHGTAEDPDWKCYRAKDTAWWDNNDGTQPLTFNGGTAPIEWCGGQFVDYNEGEIYFCSTDNPVVYLLCLKDDALNFTEGGQLGVDFDLLLTPENSTPGDANNADNIWEEVECDYTNGDEIVCPDKFFKLYDATWESSESLDEYTFYLGAPQKDANASTTTPLDVVSAVDVKVDLDEESYDYVDFLQGCPEIKITKESVGDPPAPIKIIGATDPKLKDFVEDTTAPEVGNLVPVPSRTEDHIALETVDSELVLDGNPILDGSEDVISGDGFGVQVNIDPVTELVDGEHVPVTTNFDLIQKDLATDSSGEPVYESEDTVPVLVVDDSASSCSDDCLILNVGGNLIVRSRAYTGSTQTLTVGEQELTVDILAEKLKLSRKLQNTLIRNTGDSHKVYETSKTYDLELDASLYTLTQHENKVSVSLFGTDSYPYRHEWGKACVSIHAVTNYFDQVYDQFGFKDYTLSLGMQEGKWVGDETSMRVKSKPYDITKTERTDTLYSKTVTLKLPEGKTVTVNPGVMKIAIDYQRIHNAQDYRTVLSFSDKYTYELTPYQTYLHFSKAHKLTITDSPNYLDFKKAKELKLIPKDYEFERHWENLEYEERQMALAKKRVESSSSECQTSGFAVTDLGSDNIDLWSAWSNPGGSTTHDIPTLKVTEEPEVPIDKKIYFDDIEVSIGTKPDDLLLKGVAVTDTTYESAPPDENIDYTKTDTQNGGANDARQFHHNTITFETLSAKPDVLIYSVRYAPGPAGTPVPYRIESSYISLGNPIAKEVRNDYLYTNLTDNTGSASQYDAIGTTKLVPKSNPYDTVKNSDCFDYGHLLPDGSHDPCKDSDSIDLVGTSFAQTNLSSATQLKSKLVIPVTAYDSNTSSPNDTAGAQLPLVSISNGTYENWTYSSSPKTLATVTTEGSTPTSGFEATVEYDPPDQSSGSETTKKAYVPMLDSCPVTGETIQIPVDWDELYDGDQPNAVIGEANVLTITPKIAVKAYDVKCGVLAEGFSATTFDLPPIEIYTTPVYKKTYNICVDGSSTPIPVTFLVTDVDGETDLGTPDGYLITPN